MDSSRKPLNTGLNTLESALEQWEKTTKQLDLEKAQLQFDNSLSFWLKLAGGAVAGYILWTNRFRLQRVLEANGIRSPWLKGSLTETVRSGAAKVAGKFENGVRESRAS